MACRIEGPSTRGFGGAPSAAAQGWHQVARHMYNLHGIIGVRSASQLAPGSVAAMGKEYLWRSASLTSHCNQKYTMRSNIFELERILSQSGTLKKVSFKEFFSYEFPTCLDVGDVHATSLRGSSAQIHGTSSCGSSAPPALKNKGDASSVMVQFCIHAHMYKNTHTRAHTQTQQRGE